MHQLSLVILLFFSLTYSYAQSSRNVIHLNLSNTQTPNIPNFRYLHYLESLDLSGNDLTEIPDWVQNLPRIKRLYLNDNKITEIPSWIGNLESLEELHLGNNKITKIPKSISKLDNLISLVINHNEITKIHPAIASLENLHLIDASYNQLTHFPKMENKIAAPRYNKNKEKATIHVEFNQLSMREKNLLQKLYAYKVYL